MVDKVAMVFLEFFGFLLSISFHGFTIFTQFSSGEWTRGPSAAQVCTHIVSLPQNNSITLHKTEYRNGYRTSKYEDVYCTV
jgi:hypothetical protein